MIKMTAWVKMKTFGERDDPVKIFLTDKAKEEDELKLKEEAINYYKDKVTYYKNSRKMYLDKEGNPTNPNSVKYIFYNTQLAIYQSVLSLTDEDIVDKYVNEFNIMYMEVEVDTHTIVENGIIANGVVFMSD